MIAIKKDRVIQQVAVHPVSAFEWTILVPNSLNPREKMQSPNWLPMLGLPYLVVPANPWGVLTYSDFLQPPPSGSPLELC
jgi:hypothetical protein